MRISLCIPAIVLYCAVRVVYSNCVQVGTVLFTTTDLVKKCWSESDKALLKARLIMQDVLPDPDCIDFSKPDMVLTLLDYFQSCYDIISLSTYGNIQNLMYLAMSDALGGYLRGYALPLTRMAFYSGQIKYSEARKLFRLYDDIRAFLNTNGIGWTKPQKLCKNKFIAKPLVIGDSKGVDPCSQLYTIVKKSASRNCCQYNFNEESQEGDAKVRGTQGSQMKSGLRPKNIDSFNKLDKSGAVKKKTNVRKQAQGKVRNETEVRQAETFAAVKAGEDRNASKVDVREEANSTVRYGRSVPEERAALGGEKCVLQVSDCECFSRETFNKIVVPLPVLDDCKTLHTIAVPFKVRPLRNVQSRKSAFILEHYYVTVIKCLMSKCSSENDVKHFNAQFHTWLVTQVFPHLEDEQWYPAFGGVYRITETIRKLGADFSIRESAANDIGYIFSKGFEFEDDTCEGHLGKEKTRQVGEDMEEELDEEKYRPRKYFLGAIIVLLMIWTCVCCACVTSCCAHGCGRAGPAAATVAPNHVTRCAGDERFLNFHFLVSFFKKNQREKNDENLLGRIESFYKSNNNKIVNYFTSEKEVKIGGQTGRAGEDGERNKPVKAQERRENQMEMEVQLGSIKKGMLEAGECNIPILITTEEPSKGFQIHSKGTWPYEAANLDTIGKTAQSGKGSTGTKTLSTPSYDSNLKDNKKLTLWNKLSNKIVNRRNKTKNSRVEPDMCKREADTAKTLTANDRKGSTRKEDLRGKKQQCLPRWEALHTTSLTSTNSFSHIQVDEETRNGRNRFFNRMSRRRKYVMQSSLEETTGESDSEREATYSSESSDSTETTLN